VKAPVYEGPQVVITAKSIEEALEIAAEGREGRDQDHLLVDVESNWKTPRAFARVEPGQELKILAQASFGDLIYQPPSLHNTIPAAPQEYTVADLRRDEEEPEYVPESPEEETRAQALKRLGGGPIVREEEQRRSRNVKVLLNGLRTRDVL